MTLLNDLPLVAILRGITPNEIIAHTAALVSSGFRAIEVPTNSPQWEESVARAVKEFGETTLIGAGTVLTSNLVNKVRDCGGKLIVTPNVNIETIKTAVASGMLVCCGCLTPSEAFTALNAGAQILKIFPAGNFGPAYIKAIKTVLPLETTVLAVGGITPENMHHYLDAGAVGAVGAGLGSDLYKTGQSVEQTTTKARAFVQAWNDYVAVKA